MHDVSNAINILDSTKGVDKAICKTGAYKFDSVTADSEGKCGGATAAQSNSTAGGLSALWEPNASSGTNGGGGYGKTSTEKMGDHTSTTISTDITALNRDQKGVVSSAFAKAHEGARYTSLMYICYQEEYA